MAKYFTIGDSYAYNLTRVKEAFDIGTVSLDDFVEFDDEVVADIADFLIDNGVTVQEWIPVSERLPKYPTKVLCFAKGRIMDRMFVGNFAKNLRSVDPYLFKGEEYERPGFYYFDTEYEWVEETCVTHWMPLPEPPKEDGNA